MIFTAKEAIAATEVARVKIQEIKNNKVMQRIRQCVDEGRYDTCFRSEEVSFPIRELLTSQGFSLSMHGDDIFLVVSWENS